MNLLLEEVLAKIDEKDVDFYVQTGDLAFPPMLEKLDKDYGVNKSTKQE